MRKADGKDFLLGRLIPGALDHLTKRLRDADHLRRLPREEFASRAADIMPGHQVELTMAGIAGDHFMGRTHSHILIGNTTDLPDPHPQRGVTFTIVPSSGRARPPGRGGR
jgi:hypothetical protein